jgi:hypothetical protein
MIEASAPTCTLHGEDRTQSEETNLTEHVGLTQCHLDLHSTEPFQCHHHHEELVVSSELSEALTPSCPRVRCETPTLIDFDDEKSSSVFGDFVDPAGYDDAPPSIDTSPSKKNDTKIERFDGDLLSAPPEVIRGFSTGFDADTTMVREETDLESPELVRPTKFPLLCNYLTSLRAVKASKRVSQLAL